MPGMRSKVLVLAGVFIILLAGRASADSGDHAETIVQPGQSIQAAIGAASPGTTIHVQAGIYHENLQITKDGIHLQGDDAVLEPPTSPTSVRCDSFPESSPVTGICFAGIFDPNTLTVSDPLNNVGVEGFTVRGFSGNGVLAVGVHGIEAEQNVFVANGGYGIFSSHSSRIHYADNLARDNGDAGFYIGESQYAWAQVENNRSFGNKAEGIFFRDSTVAHIEGNQLRGNCAGLIALATGTVGIDGFVTIENNEVTANNLACPGTVGPPESGIGIALGGATHVKVQGNEINNNQPAGPSVASGGIIVFDTTPQGGFAPSHDRITDNRLSNNSPADLVWDQSGTNIVFGDNTCATSNLPGLCSTSDETDE